MCPSVMNKYKVMYLMQILRNQKYLYALSAIKIISM